MSLQDHESSGAQLKAREFLSRIASDCAERRSMSIQEYIRAYLEATGADIRDLTLCEALVPEGTKMIHQFWLAPKTAFHGGK